MTQGTAQQTGTTLDLDAVGSGFFVVNNGVGNSYTRDGSFELNGQQQIVMSGNGMGMVGGPQMRADRSIPHSRQRLT